MRLRRSQSVAAGIAESHEAQYTSIKERIDYTAKLRTTVELRAARHGCVAAIKLASRLEDGFWLFAIENRRAIDSAREGMLSGFTLGNYLMFVEYTGGVLLNENASISSELSRIFARIGTTSQCWQGRVKKSTASRWFGSFDSAVASI